MPAGGIWLIPTETQQHLFLPHQNRMRGLGACTPCCLASPSNLVHAPHGAVLLEELWSLRRANRSTQHRVQGQRDCHKGVCPDPTCVSHTSFTARRCSLYCLWPVRRVGAITNSRTFPVSFLSDRPCAIALMSVRLSDRPCAIAIIAPVPSQVRSQLNGIIRPMYSNPQLHGARLVAGVLSNDRLVAHPLLTPSQRIVYRLLCFGTPNLKRYIMLALLT